VVRFGVLPDLPCPLQLSTIATTNCPVVPPPLPCAAPPLLRLAPS
jgi:hypothetical protein